VAGGEWRRLGRSRASARVESSAVGARIEAQREVGCGDVPLPTMDGSVVGLFPSPENFSIFELNKRVLVHSGTDKTYF